MSNLLSSTTISTGEDMNKAPSTAVLITIVAAAVAMLGMIVILIALDKDPSDALTLVMVIIPVVIIQVLNSARIEKIESNTNGALTQRLDNVVTAVNNHTTSTVVAPTSTDTGTPGIEVTPTPNDAHPTNAPTQGA